MKKYQIIYADPPWSYSKGVYQDNNREERLIDKQYTTMDIQAIRQMPTKNIANRDCALFLWATDSHLKEAIELIEAWGFAYRTVVFVWEKITDSGKICANVGAWTMKNCEMCLLGVKGNMLQHKQKNNIFQLVEAQRTKHSKKPPVFRKLITDLFGDLPRIELFARKEELLFDAEGFDGWDVWGNEVESDIEL